MKNKDIIIIFVLTLILVSCSGKPVIDEGETMIIQTADLDKYSSENPETPLNLLFIHHSCGGQLMADKGETDKGDNCIFETSPNGGGLRRMLQGNNYLVHEASYNSIIGNKTDVCDWHIKFRDQMQNILICKNQDEFFTEGTKNKIVVFKSCFPNNMIISDGQEPGNPDSCEMTMANFKASYNSLIEYFKNNPDTLFVAMTAPPLVMPKPNKVKMLFKKLIGKQNEDIDAIGKRARSFNNWLKDVKNGWLKDYMLKNVVVFDYYDILTKYGESNWCMYSTGGGSDSHPNCEGNSIAAKEFVPFLNKVVRRIGIN